MDCGTIHEKETSNEFEDQTIYYVYSFSFLSFFFLFLFNGFAFCSSLHATVYSVQYIVTPIASKIIIKAKSFFFFCIFIEKDISQIKGMPTTFSKKRKRKEKSFRQQIPKNFPKQKKLLCVLPYVNLIKLSVHSYTIVKFQVEIIKNALKNKAKVFFFFFLLLDNEMIYF